MKKVNLDKIIVLDNTPKWLVDYGQETFKWFRFLSHNYGDPSKPQEGWLFGCLLFESMGMGWFHDAPLFVRTFNEYLIRQVIPSLPEQPVVNDLVRIRVNGMTSINSAGAHVDLHDQQGWAVLYYVNDSSGSTEIYHEDLSLAKTIEPKAGRIVIFPASYWHKGNPPSLTNEWRITLNFNYLLSGKINFNV